MHFDLDTTQPPPFPQQDSRGEAQWGNGHIAAREDGSPAFMLEWFGITHKGLVRPTNQDSIMVSQPIWLVADGMGGHENGHVASQMVSNNIEELAETSPWVTPSQIAATLNVAQDQIRSLRFSHLQPGTTVTGVGLGITNNAPVWHIFNVGDSRTYLFNNPDFSQITVDHSEAQQLIASGKYSDTDTVVSRHRNIITKAIGPGDKVNPDVWEFPVLDGDTFLICSDGLSNAVSNETICTQLQSQQPCSTIAQTLLELALAAGGKDNISIIILKATADSDYDTTKPQTARIPRLDDTTQENPINI